METKLSMNRTVPFQTSLLINRVENLEEVEIKLKHTRFEYFQQQLLYNAFREVMNEIHLNNVKSYALQDQTLRLIEKKISACEALNYLRKNEENSVTESQGSLLNLKHDDVIKLMDEIDIDDGVLNKEILPLLYQKIVNKGLKLLSYSSESEESKGIAALPGFVAEIRKKTNAFKELGNNNENLIVYQQQLISDYFIELVDAFNTLIEVTEEFPLIHQLTNVEMRVKVGSEKFKLIANEVEQLKIVLCQKIYTTDQLKALNRLKNYIANKTTEIDNEVYDLQSQLNTYMELGNKFLKLAEEFGKVKSDLEILKWAGDEFSS